MSTAAAVHTIVGALASIEEHVGAPPEWVAATEGQATFLREVYAVCRPEVKHIPEIESCGSTNAVELNAFAARRGLAVSFEPFGPDAAGALSVLDLRIAWTAPGYPTTVVSHDQHQFPAVRLPESQVTFRRALSHAAPIAVISTLSGDAVYLTPLAAPRSDLVALVRRLTNEFSADGDFGGVVFPMVDLGVQHDLDFIGGLATRTADGRALQVAAAEQKLSLQMNEHGARAEALTRMEFLASTKSSPPPDLAINAPFLVWILRPSLAAPLFVGHVTREDWRTPGSLASRLSKPGT